MIIYQQLSGRLGNQLFQWAFAHEVQQHYGIPVRLFVDKIHFPDGNSDDLFSAQLGCEHVTYVRQIDGLGLVFKFLDKVNAISTKKFGNSIGKCFGIWRQSDSFSLDPLPNKPPKLISGFFINSAQVKFNSKTLFAELTREINRHMKEVSQELLPEKFGNYQVLHVRRGDFVNNVANYGLLDAEYYERALIPNLPIVLCTDSKIDAREIIERLRPTLVLAPEEIDAWTTLGWMRGALHVVTSNSTLSWWGGFLALGQGRKVVIPDPYYLNSKDSTRIFQLEDFVLVPSTFID